MAVTFLGEELIVPLDKVQSIVHALSPVQQQQVIELMMVNHLYRMGPLRRNQRIVMEAFIKHVWQLLDQTENGDK